MIYKLMQSTLRGINYTCKFVYHFGATFSMCLCKFVVATRLFTNQTVGTHCDAEDPPF